MMEGRIRIAVRVLSWLYGILILCERRDPNGVTLPSHDHNGLMLTAEDCVWLCSLRIGLRRREEV
jgi:hypothetical protein